jgi:multidrug efflux pump subunit AcrA (membrane-fusion protein)
MWQNRPVSIGRIVPHVGVRGQKKKVHQSLRLSGVILVVVCSSLAGLIGCERRSSGQQGPGKAQSREAVAVMLAPVSFQGLERTVEVVGTLWGDEQTTISAKVPGRIQTIHVDVGDRVDPRQPLAQIDPTDYELTVSQREMALREALAKLGLSELPRDGEFDVSTVATVERAKFQAANAKAKLERARQLFQRQPPLISEQDYADLETAYEVAERDYDVAQLEAKSQLAVVRTRQSELEAAQQRLADTTVRAPARRTSHSAIPSTTATSDDLHYAVTQRRVSTGEYVREGDAMFALVVDDPIRFRAAVPERHLAQLQLGQRVDVRVESYEQSFPGEVRRINPAIDPKSRAFEIEVNVPNPQRLLRSGAFARGTVVTGADPNVPFVPQAAVVSFAGVDRVFTVRDGKAVEHVVRVGPRRDDHVAIIEGLKNEQAVIVAGQQRLANDDPVVVKNDQ